MGTHSLRFAIYVASFLSGQHLAAAQTPDHGGDASKALVLVQKAYACDIPSVRASNTHVAKKVTIDPSDRVLRVSSEIFEKMAARIALPTEYSKAAWRAPFKLLEFSLGTDGPTPAIIVRCRGGTSDYCIWYDSYDKRLDGSLKSTGGGSSSGFTFPACDAKSAKAALLGLQTLAEIASAQEEGPDAQVWAAIEKQKDPVAIRRFLADFPKGSYADKAKTLLTEIESSSGFDPAVYESLLKLEAKTYFTRPEVEVKDGPGDHFNPKYQLEPYTKVQSIGSLTELHTGTVWLKLGPREYVDRARVISVEGFSKLRTLINQKDIYQKAFAGVDRSRNSNLPVGVYGFGCFPPENYALFWDDKFILWEDNGILNIQAVGNLSYRKKISLSGSRTVTFPEAGSVRLFKTKYLEGKPDFREIGFIGDRVYALAGQSIMFTRLKKCVDQKIMKAAVFEKVDAGIDRFSD